jgi:hypothetical protein
LIIYIPLFPIAFIEKYFHIHLFAGKLVLEIIITGRFGHALRQIGTCVIKAFIESRESRKTPHNIGSVAIVPDVVYVISVLSIIFVLA